MADYGHVIFYSLIGGAFSLIGGLLLLSRKKTAQQLATYAAPFAAGALLAAAFLELLPESTGQLDPGAAARWALAGLLAFFLLEHFLYWFHHHHEHDVETEPTPVPLVIIGDTVHNLLDGIAIGAAFLISIPAGIVTAIAVAAHEIPQEIGDFGLLLKYGLRRKSVLAINAMSALMSTVGAVVTFWIGTTGSLPTGALLGITAGMFIYIAASDLIPAIHHTAKAKAARYSVILLLLGVLTVGGATELTHRYLPGEAHRHSSSETHHDEHEHEDGHENEKHFEHDGACESSGDLLSDACIESDLLQ